MGFRQRLSVLAAAVLSAVGLFASVPTPASATGTVPNGATGSDISWPQCGTAYPDGYSFGIVGVTGGHPFSGNPCFGSEFAWAQTTYVPPQMYINLDYGQRQDGPLICAAADTGCQAYNYGYDSAQWARSYASSQTGGASDKVGTWWLDVELGNYWSDDTEQNSYVIQGALDYLQRAAGQTTGVYSTSYMWGVLAGSFAPPNTPNWVAGAGDLTDVSKCQASLWPGGSVWVFQFLNFAIDLDQNMGCW